MAKRASGTVTGKEGAIIRKGAKARMRRGVKRHKTVSAKKPREPFRTKFIRDPIHDLIRIDSPTILRLLDAEPMQRLKSIRQLGSASVVYPGAEHSRFAHSLGAYHLAGRMLNQLSVKNKRDKLVVAIAALLHDTGHGPFSHLFEAALKEASYEHYQSHEWWSKKIIMEHPQVKRVLGKEDRNLRRDVKDVISNAFQPLYLSSIVSSQMDVDRFDYMLRDSHMTGVHYGKFDLSWMLRNLSIKTFTEYDIDKQPHRVKRIVVDARRGLSSLESYLHGLFYLLCTCVFS